MFYVKFVGMFIICFHIIFYMSSSNSSLIIANRMKAKYRFCVMAMLMFYIPPEIIRLQCQTHLKSLGSCRAGIIKGPKLKKPKGGSDYRGMYSYQISIICQKVKIIMHWQMMITRPRTI